MTTTLVIEEGTKDREFLQNNKYSVQVAKGVSAPGGSAKFNVVYHSKTLAPSMTIEMSPKYAINWTTAMPNKGAKVTYTGKWQHCELGKSYHLTSTGGWEMNNNDPHKDSNSIKGASAVLPISGDGGNGGGGGI
ncbi:hypothetical protein MY10362_001856 [Beauveria mimosiformis]